MNDYVVVSWVERVICIYRMGPLYSIGSFIAELTDTQIGRLIYDTPSI